MAGHRRGCRCIGCRHRRNPRGHAATRTVYVQGGGGGGTNWGMIALIGGGAFLLMRSGALGSILGGGAGTVTPSQLTANGYTDLGNGYYRSNTTGQTVYRNPATGQVQPIGSSTIADPWLRTATQIAASAAPGIVQGITQGIGALFNPDTWSGLFGGSGPVMDLGTGGAVDTGTGSLSTASPDILSGGGGYVTPLPPLPDLTLGTPTLDFSTFLGDLPSYNYGGGSVSLALPDINPNLWYTDVSLAPLDTTQIEPIDYSGWF